jgi:hypothetical protein
MQKLSKEVVFEKLLKYGLFPEKLCKIFSSESFGEWAIKNGISKYQSPSFSDVKFRLTRNNNAPRILNIPHPAPYYKLCFEIKEHWKDIEKSFGDLEEYQGRSMITPLPNNLNKRLVSMLSYERRKDEKFLILDKSFEAKYFVQADIANCYASIYSHSIPWALVGKIEAKENARNNNIWYNELDKSIRNVQRNETVGIPIGPDTSLLISEIILTQIDKKLENYKYFRYIDDYKCYCKTKEEGESFINTLSKELEYYNLRLNQKKTEIILLPKTIEQDWVRELKFFHNTFLKDDQIGNRHINLLSQFFDLAIKLTIKFPNDSPIRYAVTLLSKKTILDNDAYAFIILLLSRICFIYPYFIDLFDEIFNKNKITAKLKTSIEVEVNSLLNEHINYSRSDVALWGLYFCIKYELKIFDFEIYANKLISQRDCLPTLLAYRYAIKNQLEIKKYLNLIEELITEQVEDEWWVYIYTLFSENKNKPVFKKIKYKDFYLDLLNGDISFIVENLVKKDASQKDLPF